jgi:hypothetical protein
MDDTQRLIKEFLAKGGVIQQLARGARSENIEPLARKRGMMGRAKAKTTPTE